MFKNEIFEIAKAMMMADNETTFEKHREEFYVRASDQNIVYFEDNWLNCTERWARHKRYGFLLSLIETNNPNEVVNKQFKSYSINHAKSSMGTCLKNVFSYLKAAEATALSIQTDQINKTKVLQYSDPLVQKFFKNAVPIMAYSWAPLF